MDRTDIFSEYFDRDYMVECLQRLARIPTQVEMGYETFIESDNPKLVKYVQEVLRPEINRLGYDNLIEAGNNLIVKIGSGKNNETLLIQNYTVTQHFNLMKDPFSGKIGSAEEFGIKDTVVFGQGVSQNKSHQTSMLAVLKLMKDASVKLNGTLYWAINNEGKSSHECSKQIVSVLNTKPDFSILQINTGMKLWLGNRGRVDVNIHVKGKAGHSGDPGNSHSAIDAVNEIINRLKLLSWHDTHPKLGGRHAIVYKIKYFPIAPHTLPSDAWMAIDRRLLPGDNVENATQEIIEVIGDMSPFEVKIEKGVTMVPAMVEENLDEVVQFREIIKSVIGNEVEIIYGQGAFDAGGLCEMGIPTVMYGCAAGDGLLGTDFIPIADVEKEAEVLFNYICKLLT